VYDGRGCHFTHNIAADWKHEFGANPSKPHRRETSRRPTERALNIEDNGKELYYHAPDGKLMATPVTDSANLALGAHMTLFEFHPSSSPIAPFYSVSRDGQRFLLSTIVETEATAPLTMVVTWAAGPRNKRGIQRLSCYNHPSSEREYKQ